MKTSAPLSSSKNSLSGTTGLAKLKRRPNGVLICGHIRKAAVALCNDPADVRVCSKPIAEWTQLSDLVERHSPEVVVFSRTSLDELLERQRHLAESFRPACRLVGTLSPVNSELVRLVAKGLSNSEIGRVTGMKPRTVRARLSDLYHEFEVTNRTELVGIQIEEGH